MEELHESNSYVIVPGDAWCGMTEALPLLAGMLAFAGMLGCIAIVLVPTRGCTCACVVCEMHATARGPRLCGLVWCTFPHAVELCLSLVHRPQYIVLYPSFGS